MGCTYSDAPSNTGDGFTFRVYNVDNQGVQLNPGKIKVSSSHLILYQKGKEDIRWPLRCLRRYGFDAELFSFESGRRCQTGPGIYAFKCRHAEDLFIKVQESIQRAGEEDQQRAINNGGSGSSGGSHALFTQGVHANSHSPAFTQHHEHGFMVSGSSPGNTLQMRLMNSSSPQHQYMNGVVPSDGPQYINTGRDPRSGAFPIEESAPLIDFMNHPGQHAGGPGVRGQVHYAVILPSSMENLLDEEGQDAVTNFPCPPDNDSRITLPPDLPATVGPDGLTIDDVTLNTGDSDVFLPDTEEASRNYINIGASEPSPPVIRYDEVDTATETSCSKAASEGAGGLAVDSAASFTSHYANLVIHRNNNGLQVPAGQKQKQHTSHYLELDLNPVLSDCPGASGGVPSQSPTSPISNASMPETSSSYAKIDFNKTEALSHSTRAGTNGEDEPGARKTRHNSTIGM